MDKETALKWYKQALHDLKMAEKNIPIKGYDVASFLAHQAVEEYDEEIAMDKVDRAKTIFKEIKKVCKKCKEAES